MKISVETRASMEPLLIESGVVKDDIALDDLCNSAECLIEFMQDQIETYNLTAAQCKVAFGIAMQKIIPDDRLYESIKGSRDDLHLRSVLRNMSSKALKMLDEEISKGEL